MDCLPPEIINVIISNLDNPSRYYATFVCKLWNTLTRCYIIPITNTKEIKNACRSGDILSIIHNPCIITKDLFYVAYRYDNKILLNIIKRKFVGMEWDVGRCFRLACLGGNINSVKITMNYCHSVDLRCGMEMACRGGHMNIVQLLSPMVERQFIGRNVKYWNEILSAACEGGNMDIINMAISKGANNWDSCVSSAYKGNHQNIINLVSNMGGCDPQWGFMGACLAGNIDRVNYVINKGEANWDVGLVYACKKGHLDIVKLIIRKGLSSDNDLVVCFKAAFDKGHLDIVTYIIEHCGIEWYLDFDILRGDWYNFGYEMGPFVEDGANNLDKGLALALMLGHRDIAKLMVKLGAKNWDHCIYVAHQEGYLPIINTMTKISASN